MFDIPDSILLPWALTGASVLCSLVAFAVFMARVLPLKRCHRRAADPMMPLEPEEFEQCAVIVYSRDQASQLEILLPEILGQDYPAPFEVIVVNEGDSPAVNEVVGRFQVRYPNLYLTATPDGARSLSRKKLAITLGIKATRKPIVVLTTAGTEVHSSRWLRSMTQHFRPAGGVEVVLGFATAPAYDDTSMGARRRSFDFVADSAAWICPAVKGHPWRGTEHNLAYRRDTFFANKGFSRHLNLRHGDDDIFISEIACGSNTAVELCDDSVVTVPGALSPHAFREEKARRAFTSRFIPRRPRVLGGLGFTAYFLSPLLAVLGAVFAWPSVACVSAAAAALVLWYVVGLIWNSAMKILHGRNLCFVTPLLAFTRPWRKMRRGVGLLFKHNKRYTWE